MVMYSLSSTSVCLRRGIFSWYQEQQQYSVLQYKCFCEPIECLVLNPIPVTTLLGTLLSILLSILAISLSFLQCLLITLLNSSHHGDYEAHTESAYPGHQHYAPQRGGRHSNDRKRNNAGSTRENSHQSSQHLGDYEAPTESADYHHQHHAPEQGGRHSDDTRR